LSEIDKSQPGRFCVRVFGSDIRKYKFHTIHYPYISRLNAYHPNKDDEDVYA
jgi:hypothetical protein